MGKCSTDTIDETTPWAVLDTWASYANGRGGVVWYAHKVTPFETRREAIEFARRQAGYEKGRQFKVIALTDVLEIPAPAPVHRSVLRVEEDE